MRSRVRRRQGVAALVSFVFVFPVLVLLLGALHSPDATPPTGVEIVPGEPSAASFERAFELVPLGRQLVNSTIVVAVAVPLTVLTASWAGFVIAQLPERQRRLLIGLSLVLLMIPLSALWVPRFILFRNLELTDTYVPLVAPALMGTSPFYVLLFYWSYRRLPGGLVDAARLEGLGPFAIWRRVAAPLVRPTAVAVGVLAFIFHWGNFVDALLYLTSPEGFTLPLGLRALSELGPTDYPTVLAGCLVATAPSVVAFALVQRLLLPGTRAAGWLGR